MRIYIILKVIENGGDNVSKENETQETAQDLSEETKAKEAQTVEPEPEPGKTDGERAVEQARADAEEYKRKWYAVTAEYENYRKRTQSARTQAYTDGRSDVAVKLLPIADNLERALLSCKEEQTAKGIEMVLKSFRKFLEEEKITEINPVGEAFDPETSEAIMAVEGEGESGTVKEVYLKGYVREGKVLRFAQVVVIK